MSKQDRTVGAAKRVCMLINILLQADRPLSIHDMMTEIEYITGVLPQHCTIWRDIETLDAAGLLERRPRPRGKGYLFRTTLKKGEKK